MKQRTFIQCLVALAVLTLIGALWPRSKPRSVEPANPATASTAVTGSGGSLEAEAPAFASPSPFWRRSPAGGSRRAYAPTEVRVYAAQALAMVNQTPVQLRDLMPVRPGEVEKELTPEQYDSRLQRAIEMELTFQAARAQDVELTPAQKRRLEQIAARSQTDLAHYRQYGLSWSSSSPEQVEFEKRLLAAQMLEQNLVAQQAAVTPSPDPAVQFRYEQARRELIDQLQASANITLIGPAQ